MINDHCVFFALSLFASLTLSQDLKPRRIAIRFNIILPVIPMINIINIETIDHDHYLYICNIHFQFAHQTTRTLLIFVFLNLNTTHV